MLYKVGRILCIWLIHILYRIRVVGKENVPIGQGYIVISNHRSNFDPLFLARGIRAQIFYMAKIELFQKNRFVGSLLRALGAFPVERGKGDSGSLKRAEEIVQTGGVLGIFIEGTRSRDGRLGRPKSGAALISHQTGADVLPCAISFGDRLRFRTQVTISYGKLIKNEELGFTDDSGSPHEIRAASHRFMEEITKLMEDAQ